MDTTLGKVISKRRNEVGKSQRELATAVHISNATVSRIESDDNIVPDNSTLKAIATYLDLDYNYLLALNKQIDDQPEIRMIQRAAKKMNPSDREKMLELLRKNFKDAFNNTGDDTGDLK
jgi:transcriptional regulator with XRE-family HTH domain